jgi:dienelactone hydrolase
MKTARLTVAAILISALLGGSPLRAQEPVPQRVTFQTHDDTKVTIVGDFYPAPVADDELPPVVILLHMYKKTRADWKPLIPELHKKGISALAIDLRGHGESIEPSDAGLVEQVASRKRKVFVDMKDDVLAAYGWLADNARVDLSRFGIVGASIGATVAFKYAADDLSVDAVIALSPGTGYMKIRSTKDIEKIQGRYITLICPEEELANAEALKRANPSATIQTVTPAGDDPDVNIHGTNMFGQVKGIEREIADQLGSCLGQPPEELVVYERRRRYFMPADHKKAQSLSTWDKRYLSSPKEAEKRGLTKIGTRSKKRGAMGAVDA